MEDEPLFKTSTGKDAMNDFLGVKAERIGGVSWNPRCENPDLGLPVSKAGIF
jgi:hypothetical protein